VSEASRGGEPAIIRPKGCWKEIRSVLYRAEL
jgi:hypothetical protein